MRRLGYTQWDAARDSAMFEALLASLPASLRFDPDRIFITGHSSGAGFANVIGCDYGDRIRAIAPVVGTLTDFSCKGSFAVLDIVGSKDPLASISRVAHDYWVRYNGYDVDVTTPGPVPPCEDHAAGAVDYPVLWCLHDEGEGPTPDVPAGTAHAWPAFASEAVWTFFSGLSRLAPRVERHRAAATLARWATSTPRCPSRCITRPTYRRRSPAPLCCSRPASCHPPRGNSLPGS